MCSPDHYDVTYEINPWMNRVNSPAKERAWYQWKTLHHTIIRLGGWVEYVEPHGGLPDMVFTANGGLVKNNRCVLARFRYKERQGEEPLYKKWFIDHGFEVTELNDVYFEGEGDALFAGDTLFAARGFRSDAEVQPVLASVFAVRNLIDCELINPYFYHLDTCFAPLTPDQAIYFPGAFSESSRERMKKAIKLIEIPLEEAKRFACNCVVLGGNVVVPSGCPKTCQILSDLSFTPHEVELDEFIKAGGAAKCLVNKVR